MRSISRYSTFELYFPSICKKEDPRTGMPMDFTPESEDEVIMESVSNKLDRPLVNP